MGSGCAASAVRQEAKARNMSRELEHETVGLVMALAEGASDGEHLSTHDEPILTRPGRDKPEEMLPREPLCRPRRTLDTRPDIPERALGSIEGLLATWQADYAAETLSAVELLDELGMRAADLLPEPEIDEDAQALAGRRARLLPEYFEPALIHAGALRLIERMLG